VVVSCGVSGAHNCIHAPPSNTSPQQIGTNKTDAATGKVHALAHLADDIESEEAEWKRFYELEAPEEAPLPQGYHTSLHEFEKLCVMRCLRVDRVTVGITRFVIATLGER
jgi:dynein heavy chain